MGPVGTSQVSISASSAYEPIETAAGSPAPSLLPAPCVGPFGADVGAELAALAVQSGEVERAAANDARNADEARAESEAKHEVEAIRTEAASLTQKAWFDGATAVAAGLAGGSSLLGIGLQGARALGDGLYGADQKGDEASAKGYEAGVTAARFAADTAHDASSGASDFIRSALDFYREYVATQAQTSAGALRGA